MPGFKGIAIEKGGSSRNENAKMDVYAKKDRIQNDCRCDSDWGKDYKKSVKMVWTCKDGH